MQSQAPVTQPQSLHLGHLDVELEVGGLSFESLASLLRVDGLGDGMAATVEGARVACLAGGVPVDQRVVHKSLE